MNRKSLRVLAGVCSMGALLVVACGGGPGNDAEPRLIPGGGAGDGAIDGRVNVFVIDENSDAVIGDAEVFVGDVDQSNLEGVTDADGLFSIDDDSLDGPTAITVVARGYAPTTWFGINAANVSIPVQPRAEPRPNVPTASLTGTIEGWDTVTPDADHFIVAVTSYSQTEELGDPANEIVQPGGGSGLAPSACSAAAAGSECNWELIARTGTIAVIATIIDIDTKGTPDESDDTSEVIGFAYKDGISAASGTTVANLTLDRVADADLATVSFDVATLPSGLDAAGVLMGLDLGSDGILVLNVEDTEGGVLVPDLAGDLSTARYRAFAFASSSEADPDVEDNPFSAVLQYDITDLSSTVTFGAWLPLANGVSVRGDEYSFTGVSGSPLHSFALRNSADDLEWDVALLDDRTSFVLPTLDPDPLPSGRLDAIVQAFDGDIDVQDFAIDDFLDTFARISVSRTTLN